MSTIDQEHTPPVSERGGERQATVRDGVDGLATLAIEAEGETQADEWLEKSRAIEMRTGWLRDNVLAFPFLW